MTADHVTSALESRPFSGRLLRVLVPLLLIINSTMIMAQNPGHGSDTRLSSSDDPYQRLSIGFYGGLDRTTFNVTADVMGGGSGCGQFDAAEISSRFALDLFAELPVRLLEPFTLTGRFRYRRFSATLTSPLRSSEGSRLGTTVDVTTRYRYENSLTGIGWAPGILWEFLPGIRVEVASGVTFISAGNAVTTEEIVDPLGARFAGTGDAVHPVTNPFQIGFNPVVVDLTAEIGGRLPISERMAIHPRVGGTVYLTPFASNASWSGISLGAVLGISWNIAKERESLPEIVETPPVVPQRPPDPAPDEPPAPKPFLAARITARGIDDRGNEYENPVIEIEEAPWIESVPVIPYVFFDSAQATLPERYVRLPDPSQTPRFSTDSLLQISPIDIHWQLLNVIGLRMRSKPEVTMTLTGTISSDEVGEAGERLAQDRAIAVGRYFRQIWGIDSSRVRIATAVRSVPAPPDQLNEGNQEGRRTELTFSDESMSAPVVVRRLARIASPPAVRFYPEIIADTAVTQWTITVVQGNRELLRFDGSAEPGSLEQRRMWSLTDLRVNRDLTAIGYRLDVRDITGQTTAAEGAFKVTERIKRRPDSTLAKVELQEYSLVGFDYNSAALLPRHLAQLDLLARSVPPGAEVKVVGYTDRLGDPERNRQLSLQRAEAVREALLRSRQRSGMTGGIEVVVQGLGQTDQLFNNDLPEGRILSRRVRIMVSREASQ